MTASLPVDWKARIAECRRIRLEFEERWIATMQAVRRLDAEDET